MTTSFLMLWVFLTTETLKRFPDGQPFASGPNDPSLVPVRLALLAVYVAVLGYQVLKLRAEHGPVARLQRLMAEYRHAA